MKNKIEITPVERFNISIDGKPLGEFERESSWEGFTKFKNEKGMVIAHDAQGDTAFDVIFREIFTDTAAPTLTLVLVSPDLIPTEGEGHENS